jgi:copper chaperone CopZ
MVSRIREMFLGKQEPVYHISPSQYTPVDSRRNPKVYPGNGALPVLLLKVPMCCDKCEEKVREELNELPGVQTIECDQSNQKVTVTGHVDPILALKQVKKVKKKSDFFPVDGYVSNVVSQTAPTTYTSQGYVHGSSDGAGAGLTRSNSFGRHLGRLPSFSKVTRYEAPPQEYELHAKVRDYEAPRKEYERRDHEAPRKEYERREHEAPRKEYERREYEAPRKEYERREYEAPRKEYERREYVAPRQEYERRDYAPSRQEYERRDDRRYDSRDPYQDSQRDWYGVRRMPSFKKHRNHDAEYISMDDRYTSPYGEPQYGSHQSQRPVFRTQVSFSKLPVENPYYMKHISSEY